MDVLQQSEDIPVYRMFTDILSRFIIRDTIRTSPLHTPTSVKYEAENEAVEADTKPKVTFKEEEKSSVNHIMYFACLKKSTHTVFSICQGVFTK